MSEQIQTYMLDQYPEIGHIFEEVGVLDPLPCAPKNLPEALVKVVVGQMLSGHVANVLYARVRDMAAKRRLDASWQLSVEDLRSCGLSAGKSRTIFEFGQALRENPCLLDSWPELSSEDLIDSVKSFWGMSDWTASIIAIFHLGHMDVFPYGDGSLRRALGLLDDQRNSGPTSIDPDKAAPYRSYLALYLWSALDRGLIAPQKS